jgi:YfiH family protein
VASRTLFTSRQSGNLALHVGDDPVAVHAHRAALAAEAGLAPERLFFMAQNHGTEVIEIDSKSDAEDLRECDALITRSPDTALAVLVADCAPVLLVGEQSCAVIHVGWRGLFGGIVEKVIKMMGNETFTAQIGPTICGRCYEVGNDVLIPAQQRGFITGEQSLDIPTSILSLLRQEGGARLLSATWNNICTFESAEHFSYRRERQTGRQVGVVISGA